MSGDLKERIEKMLAGLGDTADAVAESLRDKGIRGLRCQGEFCPIATLIRSEFPETEADEWGWVLQAHGYGPLDYYVDQGRLYMHGDVLLHPEPVRQFIEAFDEHGYPDMAEEEG